MNLTSSIIKAFGGNSPYQELTLLPAKELSRSNNIVFIWIDGLGYELLKKFGQNTTLLKFLKGCITSVFPTDTSSCSATFLTGEAPQQHGISGWHVYLKELGLVAKILHFRPRYCKDSLTKQGVDPKWIFDRQSIFDKLNAESYYLNPTFLNDSAISNAYLGKAKKCLYNDEAESLEMIRTILSQNSNRKYIFAYLPELDSKCHKFSIESPEVKDYLLKLDKSFNNLINSNLPSNTTIIVSSDHGLVDKDQKMVLDLDQHLRLKETLVLPRTGTSRVLYCYVKPDKTKQFVDYVTNSLSHMCDLFESKELLEKNYFGLYEPSKKLLERIGDYTLIMKGNSSVYDRLPGEELVTINALHGGLSDEELFVPLVVFHT